MTRDLKEEEEEEAGKMWKVPGRWNKDEGPEAG